MIHSKSLSEPNLSSVVYEIRSQQTEQLQTRLHKIAWGKKATSGWTLFEELVTTKNKKLISQVMHHINEVHIIENALVMCDSDIQTLLKKHLVRFFMDHYLLRDDVDVFQKIIDPKDCSRVFHYALDSKAEKIVQYLCTIVSIDVIFQEMSQERLEFLLTVYPDIIDQNDRFGNTILHYTVLHNMLDMTHSLLERYRIDPNQKNVWNMTPLNEAIRLGFHQVAAVLRDYGAFLLSVNDSQQSIIGSRSEFFQILQFFMSVVPSFFPNVRGALFYHSVPHNQNLYCCSLKYSQDSILDLVERLSAFIFESSFFCMKDLQEIQNPIFKPFLLESKLHHMSAFPVFAGISFLGTLLLVSDVEIRTHIDKSFFSKLFDRNFVRLFSDYPSLTNVFQEWPEFCKYQNHLHNILQSSTDSHVFFKPLIEACQIFPYLQDRKSFENILDDYKKTHIPVHKARTVVEHLSMLNLPQCEPHESLMFQLFRRHLQTPIRPLPQWPVRAPLPLTSFDLYEIIGNHHAHPRCLAHLNRLQFANWKEELVVFLHDISNFFPESGQRFRTMAVLGEESTSTYRLFLPPHEIDMAIQFLLNTIKDMSVPEAVFRVYKALLEHIHPFPDGNGRIIRICMSLILRHYGLYTYFTTDHKILTLEKYCSITNPFGDEQA